MQENTICEAQEARLLVHLCAGLEHDCLEGGVTEHSIIGSLILFSEIAQGLGLGSQELLRLVLQRGDGLVSAGPICQGRLVAAESCSPVTFLQAPRAALYPGQRRKRTRKHVSHVCPVASQTLRETMRTQLKV